jgi:hypothetical protein
MASEGGRQDFADGRSKQVDASGYCPVSRSRAWDWREAKPCQPDDYWELMLVKDEDRGCLADPWLVMLADGLVFLFVFDVLLRLLCAGL